MSQDVRPRDSRTEGKGDNRGTPGKGDEPKPSGAGTWMTVLLLIGVVFLILWLQFSRTTGRWVPYSFFRQQLHHKVNGVDQPTNVKSVRFQDDYLEGEWIAIPEDPEKPGTKLPTNKFATALPPMEDRELMTLLDQQQVKIVADRSPWRVGPGDLLLLIMLGLMALFMWTVIRRTMDPMGTGGIVGNFIRSPAKQFKSSDQNTTFNDVAGMEQAKRELQEIVEFLKNPAKFQKLGAQIPKGVLLMGPPGTGKTLMARATAGEAGVPFFAINGSEFIQMFVGVGASRVRDMFGTAKANSPCILFIDEIDAVGRVRGAGVGGGHDEREQTLNQILSEMDGFQQTEAVIVLAATNRPDVLDPALLRPGRFDRHVTVDRPTKTGRLGILKVHTRKVPLADDVDLERIAAATIGFSGADLKNLVNEAALTAARKDKSVVERADFDEARDRVLMGSTREEIMNPREREMTAYHEAGHALLAWLLPEVDPVHKVTIIPRGRALGLTQLLPSEERYNVGEAKLHQQLIMAMGGRAAEKIVFNEYSAGAEGDLNQSTSLARKMVSHWGMSPVVGPVAFRHAEEHPFLGKEIHEAREFSEETARVIDEEVQKFMVQANSTAIEMLTQKRDLLDAIARALLDQEAIDERDMEKIIGTRPASNSNDTVLTKTDKAS